VSLTAAAQLTPVLYVSTEMTDAQSAWRMLMLESGLNDPMAVYLTISLSIALFMNWYNRRISLVER
jgi:ABC-type amino acid transport system permease subunit